MNEQRIEPASAVEWRGVIAISKVAAFFAVPMALSALYLALLPDCQLMGDADEGCTGEHWLAIALFMITWMIGALALFVLAIIALLVGARDVVIPWVREG